MKQTPIEWMEEQLKMILPINQMNDIVMQDLLTQAKEKEQQVIEEFHQMGANFAYGRKEATRTDRLNHFKNYYNTKFKQNEK